MMTITRLIVLILLALMTLTGVLVNNRLQSQPGPSIGISSPPPNTSFSAGQTISVTIQPGIGTTLQEASAWFTPPTAASQVATSAPFTVSVSAPTGVSGPVTLTGAAIDTSGIRLQTSIPLLIVPALPVQAIQVDPGSILFPQSGQARTISVSGTLTDGSIVDVSADTRVSYASSNTRVAAIVGVGGVRAVAPGLAIINVTFNGEPRGAILTKSVRVSVSVFEQRGDLDGDNDVDQDDLSILLKALNTLSTGPGDPRDLNADGKIDAVDARILTNLCSRPRCATK